LKPSLSATTRLVVLLGDPVQHSLSPRFQNAAIESLELDAVYVALRCDDASVPGLLLGIARAGGAGNVTVPHKATAARAVERATEAVTQTGACNTFWLEDGVVHGDNTDVAGFSAAVRELLGGSPAGARVLLLGAGGAARGVACSLSQEGVSDVVVLNRSASSAESLARDFSSAVSRYETASSGAALRGERFDLVVNATSLGVRPNDPPPLSDEPGFGIGAALDLVYGPNYTPWIRGLRSRGIPATDGLEMLLHQGAAAFSRWWKMPPPMDAMRAALPTR